MPIPLEGNIGYYSLSVIRLCPNHTLPFGCLGAPVEGYQEMKMVLNENPGF